MRVCAECTGKPWQCRDGRAIAAAMRMYALGQKQTFVIAAARADSERIATPPRDKLGSLITPWHVCRGTLRQCHLDECQRTPALSPPSRQAAYKRSPFRSNSRQLRCVDIKFFRSNGSSAVHFVNSANHRCGLPALSLMNRITISGPLNARRVQTSR